MKFLDFTKQLLILDIMILNLDEKGFSDSDIATILEISKQTIHNCKSRNKILLEALKIVHAEPKEYGDGEVNKVINAFTKAFGTTKSTKYDRFAAKRLSDKYTADEIVRAIDALSQTQSDKYSPSVRSVSQFEEKLPNIIRYLQNKSNDKVINL